MKNKEIIIKKLNELIALPWCYKPLVEASKEYLKAIDSKDEHAKAVELVKQLEDGVETVEELEEFVNSPKAKDYFKDKYESFHQHVIDLKNSHAKYCDCDACKLGAEILEYKDELLK